MKLNTLKTFIIFTLLISSQVFADAKADPKIELLSKENAQIKAKIDEIASTNESLVTVKRQISDAQSSIDQNQSDSDKALAKLEKLEQIERDTPDTIPDTILKEASDKNRKAKSALGKSKDDYDAAVARANTLKSKQTELYDQFQLLKNAFERDVDASTQEKLDQSIRVLQIDKAVEVSIRTSCSNEESLKQCKEKSLKSAELSASEKGSVVFLSSLTEVRNFKLSKDEVRSEVQASLSDETSSQKQIATDDSIIIETSLKAKVQPAISEALSNQLMENIRADIYASAGGRVDYDKVQRPVDPDAKYTAPEKTKLAASQAPTEWLKDQNGCLAHIPYQFAGRSITWSGRCMKGYVNGYGKLNWIDNGKISRTDEGSFDSGNLNGHGIISWQNGGHYEGNLKNDKMNGQGVETWPNGTKYEGEFKEDKMDGQGVESWSSGDKYVGAFVDNSFNGHGVLTWTNGVRYEGDFQAGQRTGRGTEKWPSGDIYVGEFRYNKMSGHGVITWANGGSYEGDFINDQRTGNGVYVWNDGTRYEGGVENGSLNGHGKKAFSNGSLFEGEYKNNLPNGFGTLKTTNGQVYTGTFINGCYKEGERWAFADTTKEKCGF
jgi:hypothetical protein